MQSVVYLHLGLLPLLASRYFSLTTAGIGLTKNSPDYFISVAIPLRFHVPFKKREVKDKLERLCLIQLLKFL